MNRVPQRGAATVEFALIAAIFFSLLLGIMEFGRILFAFNSAAEATRFGARVAVVCDPGSESMILAKMQYFMPILTSANASIAYLPSGCDVNTCQQVQVSLSGITYQPIIPLISLDIPLQSFTTTLPRESMQSSIDGDANPECS